MGLAIPGGVASRQISVRSVAGTRLGFGDCSGRARPATFASKESPAERRSSPLHAVRPTEVLFRDRLKNYRGHRNNSPMSGCIEQDAGAVAWARFAGQAEASGAVKKTSPHCRKCKLDYARYATGLNMTMLHEERSCLPNRLRSFLGQSSYVASARL